MGLGSNHVTTTTAANFIPELWTLDVIEAAEANLVMAELVTRFDDAAVGGGDIIHVPTVADFSANNKTANTEVTPQANTEGKVDIALNQHKEVSFLIEDIVAVQAKQSLREVYTKKAGYAIAKAIDEALLGLYSGLTQYVSCGDAIVAADLRDGIQYLDNAGAPLTERALIISPLQKNEMLGTAEFVSMSYVGQNGEALPTKTGLLGELYGVPVYVSGNVVRSGTSPDYLHHNLLFQKGAFGLAIQLGPRVQANYVPQYLGTLVTVDVIYGFAELRDTFGVDLQTTA